MAADFVVLDDDPLDCPLDRIKIGMRVEAAYEDITDDITLLQFRPAA